MKIYRTVILLLSLALLAALARPTSAAQATGTPDLAAIDRYIAEQLHTLNVPGAALGIVQGDQIVHLQGFGRADHTGRAMSAQTPTLIGSLTKSFTAVAIMQLVEQGQVELDAPVQRYIPWFRVADPAASAQITVRHLLIQASGLSGQGTMGSFLHEQTGADAIERQVRALATVELTQPVGSTWQYANANYATLGLIIETVSGMPYEEYVQQRIFVPLQLSQSFPSPLAARDAGVGLAEGHQYWFGQPRPTRLPYVRGLLPAGYLVSSAQDLSRYLLAHLNGGRLGAAQILSPESMAALHRPGITIDTGLGSAMGWGVVDVDGMRLLQHDGNTNNYRAEMYLLPEQGLGFVLLLNASNELQSTPIRKLGQGVAMLLMGQHPEPVALNPMAHLIYGAIMGIAALQLFSVARGVRTLRRWRTTPPVWAFWRQIALPLAGNALVALLFLVLAPTMLLGGSLPVAIFVAPDLGYTLAIVGFVALGWSILRTMLALRLLRRPLAAARQAVSSSATPDAVPH